jgi:hypothetical protein
MQRQERKRDKVERRKSRKDEKSRRPTPGDSEEDPDIAHIVWGPQPVEGEDESDDSTEHEAGGLR